MKREARKERERVKHERPRREKKRTVHFFRASIFARFLMFLGALEERIAYSLVGRKVKKAAESSRLRTKILHPAKQFVAGEIEGSLLLGAIDRLFVMLMRLPVRVYGAFFLIFTCGNALIASLVNYFSTGKAFTLPEVIPYACALFASLILLLGRKRMSFSEAVLSSRLLSWILFDLLGLRKHSFEDKSPIEFSYLAVLLCSAVCSALSYFAGVKTVLCVFLFILFVRLAFCSPESGFVCTLLFFPLIPQRETALALLFTALSYAVKMLRSKRNFKASFYGLFMLGFAFLALFGTLLTSGQGLSFTVCLTAISGFFFARLMMCGREWIRRAASSIALAGVACAIWTVLQFTLGQLPESYKLILTSFSGCKVLPGMASQESTGVFIASAVAVLFSRFLKPKKHIYRAFMLIGVLLLAAAAILTRSPAAWAALIAVLALLTVRSRPGSFLPITLTIIAVAVAYIFFIPTFITSYVDRFSSGLTVNWQALPSVLSDCARRLFTGAGEGAVRADGNFFTHLLSANGIIGVLFLLFVVLGISAYAYMAMRRNDRLSRQIRQNFFGFSASLGSLLCAGLLFDLWSDPKLVFVLCTEIGMIYACGRVLLFEYEQETRISDCDVDLQVIVVPPKKAAKKKDKEARNGEDGGKDQPAQKEETKKRENVSPGNSSLYTQKKQPYPSERDRTNRPDSEGDEEREEEPDLQDSRDILRARKDRADASDPSGGSGRTGGLSGIRQIDRAEDRTDVSDEGGPEDERTEEEDEA